MAKSAQGRTNRRAGNLELKLWKVGLVCLVCVVGMLFGLDTWFSALSRPCTISGGDSITLPVCVSPMPLEVFGLSLSLISLAALVFTLAYSFLGRRTTKGGTAS